MSVPLLALPCHIPHFCSALTPVIASVPQPPGLLERCRPKLESLKAQACLRKDVDTSQMLRLRGLGLGVLERSFVSPQPQVAERQQMCSIGVACVQGVKAAGKK